jgi:hypothetical protein
MSDRMIPSDRKAERDLGIAHRHGIPWFRAPIPRRWHRCTVWTSGRTGAFCLVERCACGAIRLDGEDSWIQRNSRRKA